MNSIITIFKKSKVASFLLPGGLILIIFGLIMFFVNYQNKNYIEVEAMVTNCVLFEAETIDTEGNVTPETYSVDLKYIVNDKEYEGRLDGVSKYNVEDKIKIFYNPDDPTQITQTKTLVVPIILFVVGLVALVIGIISGSRAIKDFKNMKVENNGIING